MERLVRKQDYKKAKWFIQLLRAEGDPPPQLIAPPEEFEGAQKQRCVVNAVNYCEAQCELKQCERKQCEVEPVYGFKMWELLPPFEVTGMPAQYVAVVHVVVRNKKSGKYIDVTPPDEGDEGQHMIFVPSSRVYSDWTPFEIADYCNKGFEIRMGGICTGPALAFKKLTAGDLLYHETPEDLKLIMVPAVSTIQNHLFGNMQPGDMKLMDAFMKTFFEDLGAAIVALMEKDEKTYCMLYASEYRRLYNAKVPKVRENGSTVEDITVSMEAAHLY